MKIEICKSITDNQYPTTRRGDIGNGYAFYAKIGVLEDLRIMVRSDGQYLECLYPLQAKEDDFGTCLFSYSAEPDRDAKNYQRVILLARRKTQ